MAALIAPGVARYTVVGAYAGRPVANVLDFLIVSDVPAARNANVAEMANVLVQAWIDHILENIADNYVASEVTYVDLDNASGSVGATTLGLTANFPSAGLATGEAWPGNVSLRINKNISAERGQRQGRMYLVGGVETYAADAAPNTVATATQTAINADLVTFLNDVNIDAGDPQAWQSTLVVVHTVNQAPPGSDPDIVFDGTSTVNTLTVDATLATQRRRLRG